MLPKDRLLARRATERAPFHARYVPDRVPQESEAVHAPRCLARRYPCGAAIVCTTVQESPEVGQAVTDYSNPSATASQQSRRLVPRTPGLEAASCVLAASSAWSAHPSPGRDVLDLVEDGVAGSAAEVVRR